MPRLFLALPLMVLSVLGLLFWKGMSLDPNTLRSPYLGRPLPAFTARTLAEPPAFFAGQDLKGPALVNFWASWCAACREEQPLLLDLARKEGVAIYGIDYLDRRGAAREWLDRYGNPYALILFDDGGILGSAFGVLGTPETYAIDAAGIVRYRHVGALTPEVWEAMRRALGLAGGAQDQDSPQSNPAMARGSGLGQDND